MLYALVNDNEVKDLRDLCDADLAPLQALYQQIFPLEGVDPQPEIGWKMVGNDLVPPYVSFPRPMGLTLAQYIGSVQIEISIADRRRWAEELMQRLKKRNIDGGLGLAQSLWVHSRLRALEISVLEAHAMAMPQLAPLVGQTVIIDLMNLVVSGDIETAFAALMCAVPDDMSEDYHALSAEMIGWIMNEIAVYLGWA